MGKQGHIIHFSSYYEDKVCRAGRRENIKYPASYWYCQLGRYVTDVWRCWEAATTNCNFFPIIESQRQRRFINFTIEERGCYYDLKLVCISTTCLYSTICNQWKKLQRTKAKVDQTWRACLHISSEWWWWWCMEPGLTSSILYPPSAPVLYLVSPAVAQYLGQKMRRRSRALTTNNRYVDV